MMSLTRNLGHTYDDALVIISNGDTLDNKQPRSHPVNCLVCGTSTWNLQACCADHYVPVTSAPTIILD